MRRDAAVSPSPARANPLPPCGGGLGWGVALAALLFSAPALAEPRTIDDCEAIKEADAYNLCLASFGPTRAQKVKSFPGMATKGDAATAGAAPKAAERAAPQRRIPSFGGRITQRRGGRVHMEFTPRGR